MAVRLVGAGVCPDGPTTEYESCREAAHANESLDAYAQANPGTPTRHEDHVGHKIEWQNDVELERASGGGRTEIGEVYFNQTTVENAEGPKLWWTDPYGGNASPEPFPGAVCQLVGRTDNSERPTLESQTFGAGRDYGRRGVHAPN